MSRVWAAVRQAFELEGLVAASSGGMSDVAAALAAAGGRCDVAAVDGTRLGVRGVARGASATGLLSKGSRSLVRPQPSERKSVPATACQRQRCNSHATQPGVPSVEDPRSDMR